MWSTRPLAASLVAVLCIFVTAQQVNYRLPNTERGNELWGHEIKRRHIPQNTTAQRTWVDYNVVLPEGKLISFSYYSHRVINKRLNMRLQIWQSFSKTEYKLIYEKIIEVPRQEGNITVFVKDDNFRVPLGSRMGWTFTTIDLPISYELKADQLLYYWRVQTTGDPAKMFPVVGQNYSFIILPYPAIFSVAVEIDTRIPGVAGPPGPPGATGPKGGKGIQGNRGVVGRPGDKGEKGDRGGIGLTGLSGDTGLPGAVGRPGNIGPRGVPGDPGIPGQNLIDMDECTERTDDCGHVCTNTIGSFECSCNPGYVLNQDGRTCSDVDECSALYQGGCEHICTNRKGSFDCTCREGFALSKNSKTCEDVDECKTSMLGRCSVCLNSYGSYRCIRVAYSAKNAAAQRNGNAPGRATAGSSASLVEVVPVVAAGSATVIGTATTVMWMAGLTAAIILVMAVSFRRWRSDYCRARSSPTRIDDDVSRADTNSISELETDVTSCSRWETLSGRHCFANGGYHKSSDDHQQQAPPPDQQQQLGLQTPQEQVTPC